MLPSVENLHSDLDLSPSSVCGVRDKASLRVCGVVNGPDKVRLVVFRSVFVGRVYNLIWFEGGCWGPLCHLGAPLGLDGLWLVGGVVFTANLRGGGANGTRTYISAK